MIWDVMGILSCQYLHMPTACVPQVGSNGRLVSLTEKPSLVAAANLVEDICCILGAKVIEY